MTDFRALCAELVTQVQRAINDHGLCLEASDALMHRARAALAQPEPEGPTDEELLRFFFDARASSMQRQGGFTAIDANGIGKQIEALTISGLRAVLARWGRPTPQPIPVSVDTRFEFSVLDEDCIEQAGGTAPTYEQALSEGQHYLAVYLQDGPHTLELRRVDVLSAHTLPLPTDD